MGSRTSGVGSTKIAWGGLPKDGRISTGWDGKKITFTEILRNCGGSYRTGGGLVCILRAGDLHALIHVVLLRLEQKSEWEWVGGLGVFTCVYFVIWHEPALLAL